MSAEPPLKPTALRREGDGLAVDWNDGARTFVTWRALRKACPCATCNEERQKPPDPLRLVSDREVAAGAPQPAQMVARGHYAYQIVWNDGHNTGIYPIELLRQLSTPR
ncbi:MAG TPA: DUF971 domain-containing protein [Gemmataceae bacterium]|nr:DUF971 domain-containing protein [Gemmataceae bacterium]